MTERIIYGTDTESIEDYSQCVAVDVPDDMPYDLLVELLKDGLLPYKQLVVWEDLMLELKALLWKLPHMHPSRPDLLVYQLGETLGVGPALTDQQ